MKAVVFHGVGDIRLDEVDSPHVDSAQDAVVRITTSAICGTDLHFVRGTVTGMRPGTVLGHEAVGVVEELGPEVRNLRVGDRVLVPSTIACGYCVYCRAGYFSQCDHANPKGKHSGTAFFGGPDESGPFHGLQAELARVPFANVGLVRLPEDVSDDQAIVLSDIFPTGYYAATLAEVRDGDVVAVFGCGPVGLFAIASAKLLGAARVIAVDRVENRLEIARELGAEVVNFEREDPVQAIADLTGGIGVDRAIDAVGIDAEHAHAGPAKSPREHKREFAAERSAVAPETHPDGDNWQPGSGPSQALRWAVDALAKAGTLGIVGVYPSNAATFPIGKAMNKNLTVRMGNCPHRKYIPRLLDVVRSGVVLPSRVLPQTGVPLASAIDAYRAFDLRSPGWTKVDLKLA